MERKDLKPTPGKPEEQTRQDRHYSEVLAHFSRGSFFRHCRQVESAFGLQMRFVPVDYDVNWRLRREMRRISNDGRR